jgi:hypothetical protein
MNGRTNKYHPQQAGCFHKWLFCVGNDKSYKKEIVDEDNFISA